MRMDGSHGLMFYCICYVYDVFVDYRLSWDPRGTTDSTTAIHGED